MTIRGEVIGNMNRSRGTVPNESELKRMIEQYSDSLLVMIMSLPAKYREVILLYYYQELKNREIAVVLQLKESTVSVRLKRAREKLRIQWEGVDEHE